VSPMFCRQMSDMQQNLDEQLVDRESEMNSRLDVMSEKHETELSGASKHLASLRSSMTYL